MILLVDLVAEAGFARPYIESKVGFYKMAATYNNNKTAGRPKMEHILFYMTAQGATIKWIL